MCSLERSRQCSEPLHRVPSAAVDVVVARRPQLKLQIAFAQRHTSKRGLGNDDVDGEGDSERASERTLPWPGISGQMAESRL